jgi:hypothetical protein
MTFDTNPIALKFFGTPKQKLTILTMSLMGMCRYNITTKGVIDATVGAVLAHTEDKGRKLKRTAAFFQRPVIVLKGHHKDVGLAEENIPPTPSGKGFSVMQVQIGSGVRMWHAGGPDALAAFLAEHCLLHTLPDDQQIGFVTEGGGKAEDISSIILGALPSATTLDKVEMPKVRNEFLTDSMKKQLAEAKRHSQTPLFRVFGGGAHTYLLCGLEDDGDTLWAFCDLGFGLVEYGSVSLRELEEVRFPPLNLGIERDKFFTRCDYTPEEILAMTRIPTSLAKQKAS